MRNKGKRRMPGIAKLGLLCFSVYAAVSLVHMQIQLNEKQTQLSSLQSQIQKSTVENNALRQSVEKGMSNDYIASIARNKLGYAYPNERKFVDASSK